VQALGVLGAEDVKLTERQLAALRAVAELQDERNQWRPYNRVTASEVGQHMRLPHVRRCGHGARGPQSWSGFMDPGLQASPTLRSLLRRKLLSVTYGHRLRHEYRITDQGRRVLETGREGAQADG
jgi:hypothetical protein